MNYFRGVFIALDQLVNALIGGWPDETLSAATYRYAQKGKRCALATEFLLDLFFSPLSFDHCKRSYESEQKRRQLPPEYRP